MPKLTDATLTITGKSKTKYTFNIYTRETDFNAVGAIYVFTKRYLDSDGEYRYKYIYCGKAADLSTRFYDHHKEACINRNSANCICIMTVKTEADRVAIEKDILLGNDFSCNDALN
jgi:hypothetical protein